MMIMGERLGKRLFAHWRWGGGRGGVTVAVSIYNAVGEKSGKRRE